MQCLQDEEFILKFFMIEIETFFFVLPRFLRPKSFGSFTKVISKIFFKIIRQLSLFPRFKLNILDIVNFRVLKLLSMKVQYRERCYYPSLKVYSREIRKFLYKNNAKAITKFNFYVVSLWCAHFHFFWTQSSLIHNFCNLFSEREMYRKKIEEYVIALLNLNLRLL